MPGDGSPTANPLGPKLPPRAEALLSSVDVCLSSPEVWGRKPMRGHDTIRCIGDNIDIYRLVYP